MNALTIWILYIIKFVFSGVSGSGPFNIIINKHI
jgi:hypothetical protein